MPKVQARPWFVLAAAGLSVAIFVVDRVAHPDIVVAVAAHLLARAVD